MGKELSYSEFSQLYRITGSSLSEEEFQDIKANYCSTNDGIILRGLKDYFKDQINIFGEDTVREWLKKLGYDEHFFNP